MRAIFALGKGSLVHQFLDRVAKLRRIALHRFEDIDIRNPAQGIGRTAVATEQPGHVRELRSDRRQHEAPNRAVAQRQDHLIAHAAALAAKALIVLHQLFGDELHKRHLFFHEFLFAKIGHGRENRGAAVLAIAISQRTAAHAVDIGADIADHLAMLGHPAEQECVDHVEPGRDHPGIFVGHRIEIFHHACLCDAPRGEDRHHALRIGRTEIRLDDRTLVKNELDWRQHPLVARQIGPDIGQEQLREHALERDIERIVRAVGEFGRGAAIVEDQPVPLFGEREVDLDHRIFAQRAIGPPTVAHRAVRPFLQPLAHLDIGVFEIGAQTGDNRLQPEFADCLMHPLLEPAAGEHLHLHIGILQLGLAHRILQESDDIAAQRVIFGDAEGRHFQPFVPDLLGHGRHPARLDRAIFALMNGGAHPGYQLAFPEDRHHHRLVGIMGLPIARIIDQKGIALAHTDRRFIRPIFVDELDRILHQIAEDHDATGAGEAEIAARGEDGGDAVAPFCPWRRTHAFQHVETLVGPGKQALADNFEPGRIFLGRQTFFLQRCPILDPVIVHDQRIGREKQAGVAQKLADTFIPGFGCFAALRLVRVEGHCVSPTLSWRSSQPAPYSPTDSRQPGSTRKVVDAEMTTDGPSTTWPGSSDSRR